MRYNVIIKEKETGEVLLDDIFEGEGKERCMIRAAAECRKRGIRIYMGGNKLLNPTGRYHIYTKRYQ